MCPGFQCDTLRRAMWGSQDGQTAAEYLGALLVVSVIVAAVSMTPVGERIKHEVQRLVCEIAGGGNCDAIGEDGAESPKLSDCVVAEATDKLTISGEFDVKAITVKLDGGVEYTRQKRANGEVGITFKLAENGGVGKKLKKLVDGTVKGGAASSVTFALPDDAAANRFAQQIKDAAKAMAIKAATRFAGGEDPHIDFPPIESVTYESSAAGNVTAGIDEQGGYANGSIEAGLALGVKKDLTEGKESSGETTVFYKVNAKGGAAAVLPLVGTGYTGTLAGELTLALTYDKDWHATKLSVTGVGGYDRGAEFGGNFTDVRAALRHIDALELQYNDRSGAKLEFQIDLALDDATERQLALAFVRGANPLGGPRDRYVAGRQLWQMIESKGQIQVRRYDTDASLRSVGLDLGLATGGIAHETTSAELTGAEDYKRGRGFVASVICRR
jgi:hypothetical protein